MSESSDSENDNFGQPASKYSAYRLRKRADDVCLPSSSGEENSSSDVKSGPSLTTNSSADEEQCAERSPQHVSSDSGSDNRDNDYEQAGQPSPAGNNTGDDAPDDNDTDTDNDNDNDQDLPPPADNHQEENQNEDNDINEVPGIDDASSGVDSEFETEGESENSEESEGSGAASESSDSDDDDDMDEDRDGDQPLYVGAPLTVIQSVLAILSFSLSHNLSGKCLGDLLQLIILHCPQPNSCVTSLYKFKKFFSDMGREILRCHYFCEVCFSNLENKSSVCAQCGDETVVTYFIEIPLLMQLQEMFLRPGFYEDLQYRFNRRKQHDLNYEDLYDGEVYKSEIENGFLNNAQRISLMIYWDGISIFRSSRLQIWPVYYVINELSFQMRIKKENIILAGLWFGTYKPNVNLFLLPFLQSIIQFRDEGFVLKLPNNRPDITVRGKIICATCDLQAKSIIMKMMMHNGYYGCAKCRSRGQRVRVGVNSTVHTHRYDREQMAPRNHAECKRFAELAVMHNAPCYGVKGPTVFYEMIVDMIKGMSIDIMHCIFLGVVKLVTKLWFDSSFGDSPFNISRLCDVVDERLRKFKSPGFVKRVPRSIKNYIKLWKSSEFRQWFFYLYIPLLNGLLPEQYLTHHIKLVSAIFLLNQKSIFPEQVNTAEQLLHEYVRDFEILYGERFMVMNVHILLHLPQVVRELGPLWVYSCAFLEDLNGELGNLVHGTQYVGLQICSSAMKYMCLSTLVERLQHDSAVYRYCTGISPSSRASSRFKVAEEISRSETAVDIYMLRNLYVMFY